MLVPGGAIADGEAAVPSVRASGVTAVVANSDLVAIGLWIGLEAAGMCVPRDLSRVGMDDIPAAALVRTGLTLAIGYLLIFSSQEAAASPGLVAFVVLYLASNIVVALMPATRRR